MEDIIYTHELSAEDFNRLRRAVGWDEIRPEQARAGLAGSGFIVAAQTGGQTVGMARVVTDGGYALLISDVIVHPDYQKHGIGRALMERVMAHIRGGMEPGDTAMVNLMAAKGKEDFYTKFGFSARPNEREGPGMILRIKEETA